MNDTALSACALATGYKTGNRCITVSPSFDASLRRGRLTCLLGRNGAGKSTLLRTLAGFQAPLEGEVRIAGKPLGSYSRNKLATEISIVMTSPLDAMHLTVQQLVALGRSPYTGYFGWLTHNDCNIVDAAIEATGITSLAQRSVVSLSDGERQKALIAKALAQDTPVILLDEPTAWLDYPSKVDTLVLLRRLAARGGRAILISTHDLELALQLADDLWIVKDNGAVLTGSADGMCSDGTVATEFSHPGLTFNASTRTFAIDRQEV